MRREVLLPFSVQFLGRPWSEPMLFEIASASEYARGPRMSPPGFGPLPGEPYARVGRHPEDAAAGCSSESTWLGWNLASRDDRPDAIGGLAIGWKRSA